MKITANYSTYPGQGRFAALKVSVESIINQVDQVRIYWNIDKYSGIPEWFNQDKIINFVGPDKTDNGKFFSLQFCGDEYYFSCDDKLIYPEGYVEFMVKNLKYGNDGCGLSVVSLHGRVIKTDGDWQKSYYLGSHLCYSYLNDLDEQKEVDIVGTGVTAINTKRFKPALIANSPYTKMSDLVFSYYAARSKVKMLVLPHKGAWVQKQRLEGSIFQDFHLKDQSQQIEIVNKIAKLKGIL